MRNNLFHSFIFPFILNSFIFTQILNPPIIFTFIYVQKFWKSVDALNFTTVTYDKIRVFMNSSWKDTKLALCCFEAPWLSNSSNDRKISTIFSYSMTKEKPLELETLIRINYWVHKRYYSTDENAYSRRKTFLFKKFKR